jgi:hypothetical protein
MENMVATVPRQTFTDLEPNQSIRKNLPYSHRLEGAGAARQGRLTTLEMAR